MVGKLNHSIDKYFIITSLIKRLISYGLGAIYFFYGIIEGRFITGE